MFLIKHQRDPRLANRSPDKSILQPRFMLWACRWVNPSPTKSLLSKYYFIRDRLRSLKNFDFFFLFFFCNYLNTFWETDDHHHLLRFPKPNVLNCEQPQSVRGSVPGLQPTRRRGKKEHNSDTLDGLLLPFYHKIFTSF